MIWVFIIPALGEAWPRRKDSNQIIKLFVSLHIPVWECTFITSQDEHASTRRASLVEGGSPVSQLQGVPRYLEGSARTCLSQEMGSWLWPQTTAHLFWAPQAS